MSTEDQTHSARLHGEALVAAERLLRDPDAMLVLARLAEAADSPQDRAETAGRLAREAFADLPDGGGDLGYRFVAAGLTLICGVVDYDRLAEVVRNAPEGHGSTLTSG